MGVDVGHRVLGCWALCAGRCVLSDGRLGGGYWVLVVGCWECVGVKGWLKPKEIWRRKEVLGAGCWALGVSFKKI